MYSAALPLATSPRTPRALWRSAWRHVWKWGRWPLFLWLAWIAYFLLLQASGNFHEVVPGEVYRAAQPSPEKVAAYASRYHIRSILNLRGPNPGKPWYDREVAAAQAANIQLIDVPILSRKALTREQVEALIETMKNAPKPLLIHCQAGANRTGLASALYLAAISKEDEFTAQGQLSPYYGHIPLWFMRAYAMDETFAAMDALLGYD